MRVIHALSSGRDVRTGIYRSVRELAIAQADIGAEVHIVAAGSWPDDDIERHGVRVHQTGAVAGIPAHRRAGA